MQYHVIAAVIGVMEHIVGRY